MTMMSDVDNDDDLDPTLGMEDDDGEGDEGASADGDEGQGDEEDGEDDGAEGDVQEDDGEGVEPRQRSQSQNRRPNGRIRAAQERARVAEQRVARFEQELQQLRQQLQPPQGPTQEQLAAWQRQEEEQLSLMSPVEQLRYIEQKMQRQFQGQMQQQQRTLQEDMDRRNFATLTQNNPLARRLARDVENLVQERRAAGETVPREVALAFLIGREAIAKATGRKPDARSQRRVEGTRTRTTNATGQGQGDRRASRNDDSEEALARRLANVRF